MKEYSWRNGARPRLKPTERESGKRGELVEAARDLYETQGVAATTVTDICANAGLTRELFYYYYPNKDSLTQAVLDDYLTDFIESAELWDKMVVIGRIPTELKNFIHIFRRCLLDEEEQRRPLFGILEELRIKESFLTTVTCELTRYFDKHTLKTYQNYHDVDVDLPDAMIYSTIWGLMGLLSADHTISDDLLMKVLIQTLRPDLEPPDTQTQLKG